MNWPRPYGPYQLLEPVAEGGMAEIFLAATSGTGGDERLLAIKMIKGQVSEGDELIESLLSEARITIRLNHPNVVQTFDLAQHDGRYSLVMEFVDGCDLSRVTEHLQGRQERMPYATVAYVMERACRGLHYAHTRCDEKGLPLNIIHRDISPQNILLSYAGDVKVADFGIAKANVERQETQVGVIKGKFQYMSPEQAWGDTLDPRSDVYCLGAVMYELLTNRALYTFTDQFEVLRAVRQGKIASPKDHRPDLPMDLEAIVMNALERDRNDRFADAGAMQRALAGYLSQHHPGYEQADLGVFIKQCFRGEAGRVAKHRRGGKADVETRATRVPSDEALTPQPLMMRDDYVPDQEVSLLFNIEALQKIAASEGGGMMDGLTEEIDAEQEDSSPTINLSIQDLQTMIRSELPGLDEETAPPTITRAPSNLAVLAGLDSIGDAPALADSPSIASSTHAEPLFGAPQHANLEPLASLGGAIPPTEQVLLDALGPDDPLDMAATSVHAAFTPPKRETPRPPPEPIADAPPPRGRDSLVDLGGVSAPIAKRGGPPLALIAGGAAIVVLVIVVVMML